MLIAWGLPRLVEGLHREVVRGSFSGGEVVPVILICVAGSAQEASPALLHRYRHTILADDSPHRNL